MDRRTSIKWMLGAAASMTALGGCALTPTAQRPRPAAAHGYGTDPKLLDPYQPGQLWPLTFTEEQRRSAAALSDLIIPADAMSPSASAVGVVDFLDEWISAPYEKNLQDRTLILDGLAWLDRESTRRYGKPFARLDEAQQKAICDEICFLPKASPRLEQAAKFFARYRDLTAGGFYTTPVGRNDLQYVGNVALKTFDGPPIEALRKAGLA